VSSRSGIQAAISLENPCGSSIPLTNVKREGNERWIVGADPDAVERAYRGE
jgi:hypothetical protein